MLAAEASDVAEDESSSGEYETDSEEEGLGRQMLKPTFTRRQDRETIAERERLEAEEERMYQAQQHRLEDRKVETRQLVNEQVAVRARIAGSWARLAGIGQDAGWHQHTPVASAHHRLLGGASTAFHCV